MRKLHYLLLSLAIALGSLSASAVKFTVNVAIPAAVKCMVNGSSRQLTAGANEFDVAEYTNIQMESVAPYLITKVINKSGTPQSVYGGTWSIYPSSYDEGQVYTVIATNLDEGRTASCTVNVDDASLVNAMLSGYSQNVTLKNGANTVKFDPDYEENLIISSAQYDMPLYSVKLDGAAVPAQGNSFTVPLEQGCVIDIQAIFPDIDITVAFNYSEGGAGAISSVKVNGQTVSDFNGNSLVMKAGQKISLTSNSNYNIESVKMNGNNIGWTGGYEYTTVLTGNTTFDITAHPYGTVKAKVIVDEPGNIIFYKGYSYDNQVVALKAGENEIELPENNTTVSWKAADNCFISTVTVNGSAWTSDYANVTEGMTIAFTTGKIVLDKTAAVWIDNKAAASNYFSLSSGNRNNINIANGYNVIEFYDGMNPFGLSWYSQTPVVGKVYVNGTLTNPMYVGSTAYQFDLADKDVVKIFLAEEPVECAVNFTVANGVSATVTRDVIQPVENYADGFNCFKGTQVNVEGTGIKVKVNGTEINAENGNYQFVVEDPATSVAIESTSLVGIENIEAAEAADAPVFNLMGVRVGNRSQLSELAPGIYVVGGKKMVVK